MFFFFFPVSHFPVQPYLYEPAADGRQSQQRDQRNNNNSYNKKTTLRLSSFRCFLHFPSFPFHLNGQAAFFFTYKCSETAAPCVPAPHQMICWRVAQRVVESDAQHVICPEEQWHTAWRHQPARPQGYQVTSPRTSAYSL